MIAALMVAVAVALAAMVTAWLERRERQAAERNHVRAVERAELLRVEARRWELEAQRLAELRAAPHVTSYGVVRKKVRHV
ncbi:MAG: hypothetical protein IT383_20740 [Deltaproteobacteria bacterium]|nr:hypothetical protein [Deltaproteobacteria bacterium]